MALYTTQVQPIHWGLCPLARNAGDSTIGILARYVQPSGDGVFDAMPKLGGRKIGHIQIEALQLPVATSETGAVNWGDCT